MNRITLLVHLSCCGLRSSRTLTGSVQLDSTLRAPHDCPCQHASARQVALAATCSVNYPHVQAAMDKLVDTAVKLVEEGRLQQAVEVLQQGITLLTSTYPGRCVHMTSTSTGGVGPLVFILQ